MTKFNYALRTNLVGARVVCPTCGQAKKPIGRSEPLGTYWCDDDTCEAYRAAPHPGSLWPGESEAEFGYRVRLDGCEWRDSVEDVQEEAI